MGLAGSWCHGTQKVRSHSESLCSPSASRKNHLKYPLKNSRSPPPPNPAAKYEKEEIASIWGTALQWGWAISLPSPRDPDPFASASLVIRRPCLIKRGRNNGYILFPQHHTLQRSSRLWRPTPTLTVAVWPVAYETSLGETTLFRCSSYTFGAVDGLDLPVPASLKSSSAPFAYKNVPHSLVKTKGVNSGNNSHVNMKVSHLHDQPPSPNSASCSFRGIRLCRSMEDHLHIP